MNPNQFQCARCKGVFDKNRTDEEAIQDALIEHGPAIHTEPVVVICDDCFEEIKRIEGRKKMRGEWKYPQN